MHTEEKQPINGLLFLWWKSRAEMRGFMEKRARILIKLIAVAVLSGLFIWLVYKDETVLQLKQPEGELIRAEDVELLVRELTAAR